MKGQARMVEESLETTEILQRLDRIKSTLDAVLNQLSTVRPCSMSVLADQSRVNKSKNNVLVTATLILFFSLIMSGCGTVHPGGRSDFWTAGSHVKDDTYYAGVGIRF